MSSQKSKFIRFAEKIDIFTYVPVPHTYPVSTKKSKAGSMILIALFVGFLIYDFYSFVTNNTPYVSNYPVGTPSGSIDMPNIAFGFLHGQGLNQTLNDPTYFTYTLQTIVSNSSTGTLVQQKTSVPLTSNCNPSWLGNYGNVYQNLTCATASNLQILNAPAQSSYNIVQRLTINLCNPNNNQGIICQSAQNVSLMTAGGRMFLFINQKQGLDYQTGKPLPSAYPFKVLQYFLMPGIYVRVQIPIQIWYYQFSPTYLTSFTTNTVQIVKTTQPIIQNSNVTVYNNLLLLGITFDASPYFYQNQVTYATIITKVSLWGALWSVIFTGLGICLLAHNKSKFLKQNPGWSKFDQSYKKGLILSNKTQGKEDEISDIRKEIQLKSM